MKKITALLLAGVLTVSVLTAFASCKKKNTETNDDSQSYTENTEVVDYLLVESKDASGTVQKDAIGNVIYDFFRFETIDSSTTKLVSYSAVTLGISGTSMTDTSARHVVIIPSTFGDRKVTEIGKSAFYGNSSITAVGIPDSITKIGDYAFALCSSLSELTLPGSVKTLGEGAFCRCSSLATLTFAASSELDLIPENAFYECKALKSLTIPSYIKTIGNGAFFKAEGLQTLVLSEGVEKLEKMAFIDLTSLTSLVLPSTLTEIGDLNFHGCTSLRAAGVTASGETASNYVETLYLI